MFFAFIIGLMLATGAALVWTLVMAFQLWNTGRSLAISSQSTTMVDSMRITQHRSFVRLFLIALIIAVCLIEADVQMAIFPLIRDRLLFKIHFGMDVLFILIVLAVRLQFNGVDYPRLHRWPAYFATALFMGMLVTGLLLPFNFWS
jgi:hypothetical protein